jgi:putative resolvase
VIIVVIFIAFWVVLWYSISMKLSDYAKQVGVTYKTVYQWWKAGQLDAYQRPTGTIIVREAKPSATAARGYQVVSEVTEIASGLNDERPKLTQLLTDAQVGVIVVEHRDRLTRFGYGYIATLLEQAGRRVEEIYPSDSGNDLVDDFVSVITSMAVRLYGRRNAKQRAAQIQACVKRCVEQAAEEA